MNILMIGLYPSHIGGVATHTFNLRKKLILMGHNVYVMTYFHSEGFEKGVYPVDTWSRWRGLSFIKNSKKTAETIIGQNDIDIIHSHYLAPPGYVGAQISKKYGIPHVATAHGGDINFMYRTFFGKLLIKRAFAHTISLICVSKTLKKRVSYLTSVSTYHIPNGVDTSKFKPSQRKKDYLLYVGALIPEKRVGDVIDALKGTGEKLVIAGDGPERPRLEWLSRQRGVDTEFIGYRQDVPELLKRAKVLILPSVDEGFGLSILEAMAAGVPAVGRNTPTIREIIDNEKNGFLFDTTEELSNRIKILISDENLRKNIVAAGLRTAKEFTWERVARKTSEVYEKSLAQSL
ncbi:MAG: glycosyltransferase family 4 protein [Candidatus Methanofastidiosia archaeon]